MTIDLRGIGPGLRAHAATSGKTTASVVRAAILRLLDAESGLNEPDPAVDPIDVHVVKVTVRLSAVHAVVLAHGARRLGVSQGTYVAGLLDGQAPIARAADHGTAVSTLTDSTQKVAAMSTDIHRFIRLIRKAKSQEAEQYRAGLMSLSRDVRCHLEIASRLLSELTSKRRSDGSIGATQRRDRGAG